MRRALFGLSLLVALVLVSPGPASAQNKCLDYPEFNCFSECDFSWRWCVEGSDSCWIVYPLDSCVNDYSDPPCCYTIRAGLF